MIWRIAWHDWRRLAAGLMFWLLLAFGQLIIAWLAFAQLEAFATIAPQLKAGGSTLGVTDLVLVPTLNSLVLVLLLATPLLAMGGLAGEAHSGRLTLWLSAPASSSQIVGGKILGLWFATLPLLLSSIATLALFGLGMQIDWPRFMLASAYLALFCLWLSAIVVLLSALPDHPAAALALSYGVLLFLWLLDSISNADAPWHWLAFAAHLEPGFRGLLRSQDLVFFIASSLAASLLGTYLVARRRGEL